MMMISRLLSSGVVLLGLSPAAFGQSTVYTALEGVELPPSLTLVQFAEAILQSDANAEFGLSPNVVELAEKLWRAHIRYDWNRALLNDILYPYLFCKDQRESFASGNTLLLELQAVLPELVVSITNGDFWYCAFSLTKPTDSFLVDTERYRVTPLMSPLKIKPGSVEALGSNLISYNGFPSIDVQLCSGAGNTTAEDIQQAATNEINKLLNVDSSGLAERLAWWRQAKLDPESDIADIPLTPREAFWEEVIEYYTDDLCTDTVNNRLIWSFANQVSDSLLNVQFNNSGSTALDSFCAYLVVAVLTTSADVCTLETPRTLEVSNLNAQWLVQTGLENEVPWFDVGLDGTGQIVTVSDTGIDTDNCYFRDDDQSVSFNQVRNNAHRKIVEYSVFKGATFGDYELGHGTHVVGSVLGQRSDDGVNPTPGMADGVAPGAKVAFADMGDDDGNLYTPFPKSLLDVGRRQSPPSNLHSGSWGVPGLNTYNSQASAFDDYMFENDEFLVFMAAGNGGGGDAANTVGAPGTFKNGVTVGASHSCCGDLASNQLGPDHVADFSSRGPTADGRTKPDILAPGKWILSAGARPDQFGECDPGSRPSASGNSEGVLSLQGTSMATPVAAGHAALVRQYFVEGFYPSGERNPADSYVNPSGALIKAVLMNGAQFVSGVDNGPISGVTAVSPYDNAQGFGRISLIDGLYLKGKSNIQMEFWDRERIGDGAEKEYKVTIDMSSGCSSTTFSTTLTWMEAGSSSGCLRCVMNNLDLSVQRSNGTKYYPNGLDRPDSINIVERVRFDDVVDGEELTIVVKATNLDVSTQNYTLVTTGCYGGVGNTLDTSQNVFENDDSQSARRSHLIGILVGCIVGFIALLCCVYFTTRYLTRSPSRSTQQYKKPEAPPPPTAAAPAAAQRSAAPEKKEMASDDVAENDNFSDEKPEAGRDEPPEDDDNGDEPHYDA